ncbi:MAG TPA: beta-ketoacyl synthase N-terminal-like domain-containing protein [Longimicrobium sp.]|nr:beta-ketoacyl synthase N-terminal-like domain-containing protein [Longimicrobium sp.]
MTSIEQPEQTHDMDADAQNGSAGGEWDVAVIGVALRFPGADDPEAFWRNLREGTDCITFFADDELRAAGYPDEVLGNPAFVKATGKLGDVEHFDAAFFGYSPREAETLEPSHRIFLECAWEAMEDAGWDPARIPGAVAVYAGAAGTGYSERHVRGNPQVMAATGDFQLKLNSASDFLATRVAYKLDLRGPAVSVQTGCSTSLVAIHLAAQSLLRGEADVALAGGACVQVPVVSGYMHSPGGIMSPDGHCRTFDARSGGAIGGNGIGVVVLKRAADALRDGDPIRAVIRGSAVNNDGAAKVAFSAPGVEGQAAVIGEALALAGVEPDTVGFVETHGTATELGDVIEVAALTRAYRASTERAGFCALGAVKSNVGHLDSAAGVAGFIKAVLALEHGEIPPVVHFTAPNPRLELAGSPFYVADRLIPWETDGHPRRAGVSSFGVGGTNAHVVLEEAPARAPSGPSRPWQLLAVSARGAAAAERAAARLADHLQAHPELPLADVAHTLREGRRAFAHRRIAVVRQGEDAAAVLGGAIPERVARGVAEAGSPSVAFLFPGLGDHYPNMARGLYEAEPAFRAEVDRCAEILRPLLGADLRETLFPGDAPSDEPAAGGFDLRAMMRKPESDPAAERLNRTELAQPAVFVIDYALAKLWMSWGIVPEAVIGHSLGEYAAAAIAGVLSLEDALTLVAERAKLIQPLPGGAMLAVSLDPAAVRPHLAADVAIATVNAPGLSVVAGPDEAVAALEARLSAAGVVARRLPTTHAFHTPMLRPAAERLTELASAARLRPPSIPMVSNVTGTWITDAEATDPGYWSRHMLGTVRFAEGVGELLKEPGRVLLEVGPGQTLGTFVRQRPGEGEEAPAAVIHSLRYAYDRRPDQAVLLEALGRLWLAGVAPDWTAFRGGERRRRVHLPTYPWEKQRYWVDPPAWTEDGSSVADRGRRADPAEWTSIPTWSRTLAAPPSADAGAVLLVHDGTGAGEALATALSGDDDRTVTVARFGATFGRGPDGFTVRAAERDDFRALAGAVADAAPRVVIYAANDPIAFLLLAGALAHAGIAARLVAVTREAQEVTGAEAVDARAAALLGACRVVPQEHPSLPCRVVDVVAGVPADRVAAEVLAEADDLVAALRGRHRWARGFRSVRAGRPAAALREGGVYVFVGGMEGRNAPLARAVAAVPGVRIAVVDERIPNLGELDFYLSMLTDENPARIAGEAVKALAATGAEVRVERADGPGGLRTALRRIEEHWGRVDGIVHSPAVDLDLAAVDEANAAAWGLELDELQAQLAGLNAALAGRTPDFVLVESSLAGVLGSFGRVRVAMANALTDAAALASAAAGTPWTSVAWDRWTAGPLPEGDDLWIGADDVAPALAAVLSLAGEPNVLVSTGSLDERIRQGARAAAESAAPTQLYARPDDLATAYAAPSNEVEERIADVWQGLLGVEHVGVHDDFFALGGHSLLATQIIARLKDMFELELPLKVIFEAPTVAKMAVLVEEAILAEIDELSDDEAAELVG